MYSPSQQLCLHCSICNWICWIDLHRKILCVHKTACEEHSHGIEYGIIAAIAHHYLSVYSCGHKTQQSTSNDVSVQINAGNSSVTHTLYKRSVSFAKLDGFVRLVQSVASAFPCEKRTPPAWHCLHEHTHRTCDFIEAVHVARIRIRPGRQL